MMSNGKNVIESKCFNKILAHYDGIIEFNNQKNWNSSPGNQWWVIALRFFLKAFSWQNLNPIKKNQKSKCIFIENYTYIYFSLLILCSCKLLKHLEQLDSKALLLNPIVSSLPSCRCFFLSYQKLHVYLFTSARITITHKSVINQEMMSEIWILEHVSMTQSDEN